MLRHLLLPGVLLFAFACKSEPAGPPKISDMAPDFAVKDHTSATVRLADLKGKRALIWFYPKAMTGG